MRVVVIWESTRGRTKAMAEAICEGATGSGAECDFIDAKDFEGLGDACAFAIGSSTRMKRPLPKVRQILGELKNLDGIPSAAYGSYGWSGEAPDELAQLLTDAGATLILDQPIKAKDYPNEEILEQCRELGRSLVSTCN